MHLKPKIVLKFSSEICLIVPMLDEVDFVIRKILEAVKVRAIDVRIAKLHHIRFIYINTSCTYIFHLIMHTILRKELQE